MGDMADTVKTSRTNSAPDDEACWVAQAQAWRLKMEVALRRERGRLAERTHDAAKRQKVLAHASRDARVVERAIESIDEQRGLVRRRSEGRRLDALGTTRWQRREE